MINFDELKVASGTALQADKWNNLVDRLKLEVPANLNDKELVLRNAEKQKNFHLSADYLNPSTAALTISIRSDTNATNRRVVSVHENGVQVDKPLKVKTSYGYIDIGPKNPQWAHINTDRDKFYFNKEIRVDSGKIGSYNENLSLCTMGSTRMTIRTNGRVGIGTTAPAQQLHVVGGRIRLQKAGTSKSIDMRTDGNENDISSHNADLYLSASGAGNRVVVNDQLEVKFMPFGNFKNVQWNSETGVLGYDNSSRRFKENIKDLEGNFEAILEAKPKTYTRPGTPDRIEIGFIAEEFHDLGLFPLIDYDKEGLPESLYYEKIATFMLPVMAKQKKQIKALEQEMEILKKKLFQVQSTLVS